MRPSRNSTPASTVTGGPRASTGASHSPAESSGEASVTLTLKGIFAKFPAEVREVIRKQPSEHVRVKLLCQDIERQLATGVVRLSLEELRAIAPPHFFFPGDAHDRVRIPLPMDQILIQVKPRRRSDQRPVETPSEIGAVFSRARRGGPTVEPVSPNGQPLSAERPPLQMPGVGPAKAAELELPPAAPAQQSTTPDHARTAAAPGPVTGICIEIPFSSIAGALPAQVRSDLAESDFVGVTLRLPLAELEPLMGRGKVVVEWKRLRSWLSRVVPVPLDFNAAVELPLPLIVPAFVAAKKLAAPVTRAALDASIPDLFVKAGPAPGEPATILPPPEPQASAPLEPAPAAPVALRLEPTPDKPQEAPTEIASSAPALRLEKTEAAIEPEAPAADETTRAEAPVELPPAQTHVLGILAPPPETSPCPPSLVLPAPPAATPAALRTGARWTPRDVVSQACEIDSVSGAFISTHDGLFVAGQTPGFNERMLAAFAPNFFSRFEAYTLLSNLGTPEAVTVTLPERSLQVFRCGKLFFGVIGRPGEPFPAAKLAKIAAQLQFHDTHGTH